ncbi:MAG: thioredoxin family protein [Proteobacteria bacterium]|nr:thioredoxin family protein [Pseudomonadota bacterium]
MARTPSIMLDLGTEAPNFSLPDTEGSLFRLESVKGKQPFLVLFICNHCPYVKHIRKELAALGNEYQMKGIAIIAINSNDFLSYPEDSPENMVQEKKEIGYLFPYLIDESQEVAKNYRAACTPDFFLFDRQGKLFYRGQFDDSRPGNGISVTGRDIRSAMELVLKNGKSPLEQKPSLGCNIKWKTGNAPSYFV